MKKTRFTETQIVSILKQQEGGRTTKELPLDDPKQIQPDITKAKKDLRGEPKVDRAKGLKKTYDYFKALPPSEWMKLPKELVTK